MDLVRDTSSCHDDHLCQIIFKFHHVRLSYGPDTILVTHTHKRTGKILYSLPQFYGGGTKRVKSQNYLDPKPEGYEILA